MKGKRTSRKVVTGAATEATGAVALQESGAVALLRDAVELLDVHFRHHDVTTRVWTFLALHVDVDVEVEGKQG